MCETFLVGPEVNEYMIFGRAVSGVAEFMTKIYIYIYIDIRKYTYPRLRNLLMNG